MIRERQPGGGRKPQGPIHSKSEVFATRITAGIRSAIEREAQQSGQSISQVAERLLILGLEAKRRKQQHRSSRAFCYLVEKLGEQIGSSRSIDLIHQIQPIPQKAYAALQDEWRTNPFRYEAFSVAVRCLLEALKPKGEIAPLYSPKQIETGTGINLPGFIESLKDIFSSPEKLAASAFADLWTRLLTSEQPRSEVETELMSANPWLGEIIREEFYGLQDARRDLGLGSSDKEDQA